MEGMDVILEQLYILAANFLPKVVGVLVLVFGTWMVARWAGNRVGRTAAKRLDPTLSTFFGSIVKYAVLAMGLLGCLRVFGFETTSFAALLGAGGLAIGLALQGTLSNFSAGVMLLVFRPFKVDDVISVAGITAKVVELSLFTTAFDTVDNRRIIVPNGAIFGSTIDNYTHHPIRRVDVGVGTDYGADLKEARKVLLASASAVSGVLADPAPAVYLKELGGSSIDWQVRVWCNTPDYFAVKDAVTEAVKYGLDTASIGIPFPQMDVHLDAPLA
jgi:small conductance mechanosensitive channel